MATTYPLSGVQYSGIWTMQQVDAAVAAGTWPIVGAGGLYDMGDGSYFGVLGQNNLTLYSSPKQVGSLITWTNVQVGVGSMAATKVDGTLWTWGYNGYGQLGLGNITNYSSPKQVGSLSDWSSQISLKVQWVLAVKTNGSLWCFGSNAVGELGLGNTTAYSSPKQVGALTTWSKVTTSGSGNSSFAVKTDGTLWAWGENTYGQLGQGNTTNLSSPKQVGLLTNWASSAAGGGHIAAVKTDGTLWTWGYNNFGQLGLGNTTYFSSPKQVGLLTDWSYVACNGNFTLAVKTDGTLWGWGENGSGQLGLGNTTNFSSPRQIGALTNWSTLSAGPNHVLSIKTDKTLWAWGLGAYGKLGLGNVTNYSSPKQVGSLTNWNKAGAGTYASAAILGS